LQVLFGTPFAGSWLNTKGNHTMHIFEALMKDHEEVKELLSQLVSLDASDTETRDELVTDIRDALIPHSRAEESVFYNSLRVLVGEKDKDSVMHGFKEHLEAEGFLRALQVQDALNMDWKATARKLKDAIEHHIEEEETEIFAIARKVMTKEEADKLGELFESVKPQIKEEGFFTTTFEMVKNIIPPKARPSARNGDKSQGRSSRA
jgi:hemerythrin-like domain-containing protein